MLNKILLAISLIGISVSPVIAASVEGLLVSIDSERRTITMETGEIWNLPEFVALDGLEPGQLVRVTYADETIDASAIDILENSPPVNTAEETATEQ